MKESHYKHASSAHKLSCGNWVSRLRGVTQHNPVSVLTNMVFCIWVTLGDTTQPCLCSDKHGVLYLNYTGWHNTTLSLFWQTWCSVSELHGVTQHNPVSVLTNTVFCIWITRGDTTYSCCLSDNPAQIIIDVCCLSDNPTQIIIDVCCLSDNPTQIINWRLGGSR